LNDFAALKLSTPASVSWYVSQLSISLAACHPSCSKCNGPKKSDCTACYQNAVLNNGICECKTGFYYDESFNNNLIDNSNDRNLKPSSICRLCHEFCKSCKSAGPTECLECQENFEMINNECISKFNYFHIEDLKETSTFSETQLSNWNGEKSRNCLNANVMKFKNGFSERKFDLQIYAPFFEIGYSFSFYKIGLWKGESIAVNIDEAAFYNETFFENSKKICSSSYLDEIYRISGLVIINS
jgi:hypothetical protein